jgi:DNA-3-methyladenine glycosylase I
VRIRCEWCTGDPLYMAYHDEEWGVPVHDDRTLFEMLILDGAQAGLSWFTILKKRPNYRRVFDNFDAASIARYDEAKINELLGDPGIVRNRLKVRSAVTNAQAMIRIQGTHGSFDAFLWQYVGFEAKQNAWKSVSEVPSRTPESDAMSKDLKKMGFSFVGSTICYAFMQAAGMVNDHTTDCFRYNEIRSMSGLETPAQK